MRSSDALPMKGVGVLCLKCPMVCASQPAIDAAADGRGSGTSASGGRLRSFILPCIM